MKKPILFDKSQGEWIYVCPYCGCILEKTAEWLEYRNFNGKNDIYSKYCDFWCPNCNGLGKKVIQ